MTAPELLTHREAARFLKITSGTLYIWRSKGRYRIPFIQRDVGGPVYYRPQDLSNFIESCVRTPEEKPRRPGRRRQTKRGSR